MGTMKKIALVLAAVISASMSLTSCGGSSDSSSKETTTAASTTAASTTAAATESTTAASTTKAAATKASSGSKTQKKGSSAVAKQTSAPAAPAAQAEMPSEYVNAVANSVWVGMDADFNCYALAFSDEQVILECDDDSSFEGYWGVAEGDPTFYIFSDAELTQPVFAIPWSLDLDHELIILNDAVVMTEVEAATFEDAAKILEEEALVCQIADALDGTYWAGPSTDGSFAALSLENGELEFYELDADGSESAGKYLWSLDTTGLTLYDEQHNALEKLSLTISSDGSQIQMACKSGSTVLTEVSEEDSVDIALFLHTLAEGGIDEADLDEVLDAAEAE
ncbi:MAG: hypothetical protein E7495_09865 [Ruminococcus flavefaciens]|nr:hypothetical protein [Ruminococcus flavefaciens]